MRVLFITSSRLGDAVLSTGLLDYIVSSHADAKITVACGLLPVSLFTGVPGIEKIIVLRKRKWNAHWLGLWRHTVKIRWDMIVDMRNSAVSRLVPAKRRHIHGRHIDGTLHKVEQNAAVMGLHPPPAPKLWFTPEQKRRAAELIPSGTPVLGIGPAANWAGKIWPAERFIKAIGLLTDENGILPQARVAVFAAPGEEAVAQPVLDNVPPDRRIDLIARTDPGTAAAALARCAFYIGNDSGLMHCAAAAGIPTLGLFGPGRPHVYRPWGTHTHWVGTNPPQDESIAFEEGDSRTPGNLMADLNVETVCEAAARLWASIRRPIC